MDIWHELVWSSHKNESYDKRFAKKLPGIFQITRFSVSVLPVKAKSLNEYNASLAK